ncbi:MAG: hypothetical protein ABSF03_26615 [Streptosporangiaceae bacterium]
MTRREPPLDAETRISTPGGVSQARISRMEHGDIERMLNASGTPAEVAARAGNSARVLHDVYLLRTCATRRCLSEWRWKTSISRPS